MVEPVHHKHTLHRCSICTKTAVHIPTYTYQHKSVHTNCLHHQQKSYHRGQLCIACFSHLRLLCHWQVFGACQVYSCWLGFCLPTAHPAYCASPILHTSAAYLLSACQSLTCGRLKQTAPSTPPTWKLLFSHTPHFQTDIILGCLGHAHAMIG